MDDKAPRYRIKVTIHIQAFIWTGGFHGNFCTHTGAFIAAFIIYMGKFPCFWSRFTVSMLFAVFTLVQGVFCDMNWWEFPWSFIKPQVLDLTIGWGLCSAWLGWFVKPRT